MKVRAWADVNLPKGEIIIDVSEEVEGCSPKTKKSIIDQLVNDTMREYISIGWEEVHD